MIPEGAKKNVDLGRQESPIRSGLNNTFQDQIQNSEDNVAETIQWEAIEWPEDMAPSHCPIHFTNELEVAASPETIWSLLVDPKAWPSFY